MRGVVQGVGFSTPHVCGLGDHVSVPSNGGASASGQLPGMGARCTLWQTRSPGEYAHTPQVSLDSSPTTAMNIYDVAVEAGRERSR